MRNLAAFVLALAVFAIITSASAQQRSCAPNCGSGGWNAQTFGDQTYYYGLGTDRGWNGTSQTLGNETYSYFTGPNGQRRNCTTQRFGAFERTICN